ncbi:MAG: CRISPR-associated endonuclease Cas1 [Myxococcota bacterium]|nr:CRISPR-associated endonuclease Cas1 [Myxococcota bacterium]
MRPSAVPEQPEAQQIPVRMLNEFAYCPRLFFLEHVQGEFEDNGHTVEGRWVHRRVDRETGALPEPRGEPPDFVARSVSLESERLGVSARMDLVEGEGGLVFPVDYKKGAAPELAEGAYEPERIQLCAYGLVLREHGFRCEEGFLYFAQSRQRVAVRFDQALVQRTLELLSEARETIRRGRIPPPLKGSPKCEGCSMHGICLPDEVNLLAGGQPEAAGELRRLVPARDDAKPLYVQEQGARIGLSGEVLEVRDRNRLKVAEARLFEVSQVVVLGNVQVSAQAIRELCGREIPICWMSYGGWLSGLTDGLGHNHVEVRRSQYRVADDPERALRLAMRVVRVKIANCRTLLRRNHPEPPEQVLRDLAMLMEQTGKATNLGELLGVEGNAARLYFEAFPALVRPPGKSLAFDFGKRSRRPPRDPVNALLSLAYSLLTKEFAVAIRAAGMDPFLGFYHQPRFGRPALALDLMEEFRPLVADSVVLTVINTGVVGEGDFVRSSIGVALTTEGRRRFLRAFERRMEEEITHPVFGYRISYRRTLEVQVRLLARHLTGELEAYPEFRTR